MKHLARSMIALLIGLAVFFNIERMDFGQQNVIDIQTFVYGLGILAVVSVIRIPALWNTPLPVSLALWSGLYLLCRLSFFSSRPLLGGVHTYLSITEVALLSILVGLAHNVGRGLHDFEEAVKNITLSDVNRRVRNMDEAIEDIHMELVRSRRHQRPLTVMVIEAKPESIRAVLHRTVQEVQQAMMTRYVVTSLARVIGNQLRRTDMVVDQRDRGRFVILSPDTNVASSSVVVGRIQAAAAEQLGVSIACGLASFPDDALTFEELVRRAKANLQESNGDHQAPKLPSYAPAESLHE